MSGISGIISFMKNLYAYKSYNRLIVRDMASALTHRGPDEFDEWVGEHSAFANTRLFIADSANGKQPMKRTVEGYEFVISCDGELYNTKELRDDLTARGYIFETASDIEVLLYSYIHYGENCCERLNGRYAFAIWDSMRQQVFMCRDCFGAKPFFYAKCDDTFIFASEIKALFRYPGLKPCINKDGLCKIFSFSPFTTDIFEDIHELSPGCFMTINRNAVTIKRYWQLEHREYTDSYNSAVEHTHDLLCSSIKRQLSCDLPVSCVLSDDLYSNIITAVSAHEMQIKNERLCTYSLNCAHAYNHQEYPCVHHTFLTCDDDMLLENLCTAVDFYDMPIFGDSSFSELYRQVKKNYSVILSPDGADEIFGYSRPPLNNNSGVFESILKPAVSETLKLQEYLKNQYEKTISEISLSIEEQSPYLNISCLLPVQLNKTDRLSMAYGVEVRLPFCDCQLTEYVWNMPCDIKKKILGDVFLKLIPRNSLTQEKGRHTAFHNTHYEKAVYRLLLNIINDYSSPILTFVDRARVLDSFSSHSQHKMLPYAEYIIQINQWLKAFNPRII